MANYGVPFDSHSHVEGIPGKPWICDRCSTPLSDAQRDSHAAAHRKAIDNGSEPEHRHTWIQLDADPGNPVWTCEGCSEQSHLAEPAT